MSVLTALMTGGQGADYWLTRWLLQRTLAVIYLVAFLVAAAALAEQPSTPQP